MEQPPCNSRSKLNKLKMELQLYNKRYNRILLSFAQQFKSSQPTLQGWGDVSHAFPSLENSGLINHMSEFFSRINHNDTIERITTTSSQISSSLSNASAIINNPLSYFASHKDGSPDFLKLGIDLLMFYRTDWVNRFLIIYKYIIDALPELHLTSLIPKLSSLLQSTFTSPQQVRKEPLLQGSTDVSSVPGVATAISLIAGCISYCRMPLDSEVGKGVKQLTSKFRDISNLSSGVEGMKKMFHNILDGLTHLLQYFGILVDPEIARLEEYEQHCSGMIDWMTEINDVCRPDATVLMAVDEELRRRIAECYDKGVQYMRVLNSIKSKDRAFLTVFNSAYVRIVKQYGEMKHTSLNTMARIDPLCVYMTGKPGVGKSYLMAEISRAVSGMYNIPQSMRVYSRNMDDQFWTDYAHQFSVHIDDFGQDRIHLKANEYMELITIKSPAEKSLNMADLKDKGRKFTSSLVVISSNIAYPHPTEITERDALWRRRDILVDVVRNHEIAMIDNHPDLPHLLFNVLSPLIPGVVLKRNLSYPQFMSFLKLTAASYYERQERTYRYLNRKEDGTYTPHPFTFLQPFEENKSSPPQPQAPLYPHLTRHEINKLEEERFHHMQTEEPETYHGYPQPEDEYFEAQSTPTSQYNWRIDPYYEGDTVDHIPTLQGNFICCPTPNTPYQNYVDSLPRNYRDEMIQFHRRQLLDFMFAILSPQQLSQTLLECFSINRLTTTEQAHDYYQEVTRCLPNYKHSDILYPVLQGRYHSQYIEHKHQFAPFITIHSNAVYHFIAQLDKNLDNAIVQILAYRLRMRDLLVGRRDWTWFRTRYPFVTTIDDASDILLFADRAFIHFHDTPELNGGCEADLTVDIPPMATFPTLQGWVGSVSPNFEEDARTADKIINELIPRLPEGHSRIDNLTTLIADVQAYSRHLCQHRQNQVHCIFCERPYWITEDVDRQVCSLIYRGLHNLRTYYQKHGFGASAYNYPGVSSCADIVPVDGPTYQSLCYYIASKWSMRTDQLRFARRIAQSFRTKGFDMFNVHTVCDIKNTTTPRHQDYIDVERACKQYITFMEAFFETLRPQGLLSYLKSWVSAKTIATALNDGDEYTRLTVRKLKCLETLYGEVAGNVFADMHSTLTFQHDNYQRIPHHINHEYFALCPDLEGFECNNEEEYETLRKWTLNFSTFSKVTNGESKLELVKSFFSSVIETVKKRVTWSNIYKVTAVLGSLWTAFEVYSLYKYWTNPEPAPMSYFDHIRKGWIAVDAIADTSFRTDNTPYFDMHCSTCDSIYDFDMRQYVCPNDDTVLEAIFKPGKQDEYIKLIEEEYKQRFSRDPKDLAKSIVEGKAYTSGRTDRVSKLRPHQPVRSGPRLQGNIDENASVIQEERVWPCMYSVDFIWEENGRTRRYNQLGYTFQGRFLLLNAHAFMGKPDNCEMVLTNGNGQEFRFMYDPSRLVTDRDVAVYACPMEVPLARKSLNLFITDDDLKYISRSTFNLVAITEAKNGCRGFALSSELLPMEEPMIAKNEADTISVEIQGWKYLLHTYKGLCGGVLVLHNTSSPRKLVGIHSAGFADCRDAFGSVVTQDLLKAMLALYDAKIMRQCGGDIRPFSPTLIDGIKSPLLEGNFTFLGNVQPISSPQQTQIRPSILHGKLYEPLTEPVVLSPRDKRANPPGVDPIWRGVNKYGTPIRPMEPGDILAACENVKTVLLNKCRPLRPPTLMTDIEVINGVPGLEYFERMDMKTSAGYPYVLRKPPNASGKKWLFENIGTEQLPIYTVSDSQLAENYDTMEYWARFGVRVPCTWTNCKKDERKLKAKSFKPRVFCMGPAHYTMLVRKYFGDFAAAFYKAKIDFFSTVGINPDSSEWSRLYHKLKSYGNDSTDMDYELFDSIATATIIQEICEMINEWYNDGPENAQVRQVLMEEFIHTASICENTFFMKHQGMPSGHPLTVIINTILNAVLLRFAWRRIMRSALPACVSLEYYNKYVGEAIYGDDNKLSLHPMIRDIFNFQSIRMCFAKYGIKITSSIKTMNVEEVPKYQPLTEGNFLKRSFQPLATNPLRVLAPISPTTIQELTNWIHECADPIEATRENCRNALQFAFHFGQVSFESLKQAINAELTTQLAEPIYLDYMDLETAWHETFL